jgi:hypothetical protein
MVNPDKLVNYPLNSNHERRVSIPLKYAYRARKLLNLALESESMDEFYNHVSLWPSLKGVYIPKKVNDLILFLYTPFEGKKLGDEFKTFDQGYLETCLHLITDELATMDGDGKYGHEYRARERYNAIRNHQNIKSMLESL